MMRLIWKLSLPLAVTALAAGAVIAGAGVASASQTTVGGGSTDTYLSLGDSLSVGVQPDADGVDRATNQGYDTDLLRLAATGPRGVERLQLTELGCPGETTTTMIQGGVCTYSGARSQLDAATRFLVAHRGHVRLVTLAIGANDVVNCTSATAIDLDCLRRGFATVETNLTTIVARLKQADPGARARFVGLNEYDPVLAAFLQGPTGRQVAAQSVRMVLQFNRILADDYTSAGFRVADVQAAFRTTDTGPVVLPGFGEVPDNVAAMCQLTYMCTPAPVGPDIHPNATGYTTMAQAIAATL